MDDLGGWQFDPSRLNGMRVLIVEDNAVAADHVAGIIKDSGGCVLGPTRGVAGALQILNDRDVDVVLVDVYLDGGFADDLVPEIRRRSIPFVIITGRIASPTNADEGALAVFLKPVERAALIELLRDWVWRQPNE